MSGHCKSGWLAQRAVARRLSVPLLFLVAVSTATCLLLAPVTASDREASRKGYDIEKTGLTPRFPTEKSCPPITSFYASWDDVDGTRRDEEHSGIDAGRVGDPIIAPAPGHVVAVWEANW